MESKTNKGGSCLIFENNKFRRYHQENAPMAAKASNVTLKVTLVRHIQISFKLATVLLQRQELTYMKLHVQGL